VRVYVRMRVGVCVPVSVFRVCIMVKLVALPLRLGVSCLFFPLPPTLPGTTRTTSGGAGLGFGFLYRVRSAPGWPSLRRLCFFLGLCGVGPVSGTGQ